MTRMIDRILTYGFAPPPWTAPEALAKFDPYKKRVLKTLQGAQVFIADNVCQYFYQESDREQWDLYKDFPNLAPPFPEFFIEMRRPPYVRARLDGQLRDYPTPPVLAGWGVLFQTIEMVPANVKPTSPDGHVSFQELARCEVEAHGSSLLRKMREFGPEVMAHLTEAEKTTLTLVEGCEREASGERFFPDLETPRWSLLASLFVERDHTHILGPIMSLQFLVDPSGALQGEASSWTMGSATGTPEQQREFEDEMDGWETLFFPAFLALSFLHCKNVKIESEVPPMKLSRAHQKKHGRPLVRFHTLQITPMKTVLEREGQASKTGLRQALHICRGHFKTYTEERKLFGRYAGTYWWDAHVRGTLQEGMVVKDYQVNEPAQNP